MLLNPSALQSSLRPDARFRQSLSGEIQTTCISQVVTNSPRQATSREVGWCNCESKKSLSMDSVIKSAAIRGEESQRPSSLIGYRCD